MPDLSLFKPLCKELDITLNDLMSGEKVKEKEYQEKFEENIVNTIDYTNKKINKKNRLISEILIFFSLGLIFSAFTVFSSESSWGSIYSIIGIVISLIGFTIFNKEKSYLKRLILNILYVIFIIGMLLLLDYSNVKLNDEAPRFRIKTTTIGNVIYYDTLFYDVYRCNFNEDDEYWIIEKNHNPSDNDLINYCKQ